MTASRQTLVFLIVGRAVCLAALLYKLQDLLREPQPTLFLDMGQGSREQSLPVAVSCRELLIQTDQAAHCASYSVPSAPQEG